MLPLLTGYGEGESERLYSGSVGIKATQPVLLIALICGESDITQIYNYLAAAYRKLYLKLSFKNNFAFKSHKTLIGLSKNKLRIVVISNRSKKDR